MPQVTAWPRALRAVTSRAATVAVQDRPAESQTKGGACGGMGGGRLLPSSRPPAGSGCGDGIDGEPGQARVFGPLGQRQVMVRVDLDHVRVQRFGQFPLLGGTDKPVAGGDERGCGQPQVSCPRPGVIAADRASRGGEFKPQPAAELGAEPWPECLEFGLFLARPLPARPAKRPPRSPRRTRGTAAACRPRMALAGRHRPARLAARR